MPDSPLEQIVEELQQAAEFFSGVFPDSNECTTTDVLGHAIGVTTVWFGSASQATQAAQGLAASEAFKNCFSRCGQLSCPGNSDCVFDSGANQGFTGRCRYFSIYLGIQRRYFIRWHVALAFARCPCACKCQ